MTLKRKTTIRWSALILTAGFFLFLAVLHPFATGAESQGSLLDLDLSLFASGLDKPVSIAHTGPGDDRLFVVERDGTIRIIQSNGSVEATPFLDIEARVNSSANEMGLLGLVFDPDYANNRYFYVNYTSTAGGDRHTRISRFQVQANNPDEADPNSEEILLTVRQWNSNHNAGDIHFGPDGYLYIPLGDGGGAGDVTDPNTGNPGNNAQTSYTLLGKIARVDVSTGSPLSPAGSPSDCDGDGNGNYTIPPDNPFRDGPGGTYCDEIWAFGLRNPWRSSFDRLTGHLYIGDVGQNEYEEINFQAVSSPGGENYGWRCYEGNHPYNTSGCSGSASYDFPVFEYDHDSGDGCSVIGGYVYRGTEFPAMVGRYILADYCTGNFWDLKISDWSSNKYSGLGDFGISAFGENHAGELFVANTNDGMIYKLTEGTPITPTPTPAMRFFIPSALVNR